MEIFNNILTVKETDATFTKLLKENPYFKRIDMPKPVYVKVHEYIEKTRTVFWKNQHTNSKSTLLDFFKTHEPLLLDEEILEAMILFGDQE